MFESFSTGALTIIDDALQIAKSLNKKIVGTEHLLLALYKKKDTICHFLLEEKGITYEDILDIVNNLVIFRKTSELELTYTKKFQEIILYAKTLSIDLSSKYVYDEHIFYVLLKEEESVASIILDKLDVDKDELMDDIEEIFNFFDDNKTDHEVKENPYPFLINLTNTSKIHPFIKRSNYVEKINYILSKKQKNNPLLIGNAGVGKTAIVEGLSEIIDNVDIYQLDLGLIVSGTKYRGELEEKITKAMEFIKEKKAIVFIDEIHNIVGAGSNDGSLDIANILKPYLSRSDIKLIGSTTLDEYYRFIEKDKALTRRFQNIYIDEPNDQETYKILKGIKQSYEEYHNVKYSDKLIKKIIKVSKLYLVNKTFPDKAIDLMDEVGSRKKMSNKDIYKIVDEVIEDTIGIKMPSLNSLKKIKLNYSDLKIKYYQFINRFETQIDINNIGVIINNDKYHIELIKDDLKKVFNFKDEMYLEIDLENYYDITMQNNLIGSQKGYVGYEQGGILSEHIIKYPLSLIYLKNFSKAHQSIQNFFKSIFNKNYLIDSKGRKIFLINCMFIIDDYNENNYQSGFILKHTDKRISINVLKNIDQVLLNNLKNKYDVQIKNIDKITKNVQYDLIAEAILNNYHRCIFNQNSNKLEEEND